MNAANFRRRNDDELWLSGLKEFARRHGVGEVEFAVGAQREIVKTKRVQTANDRRAHQTAVTSDKNTCVLVHQRLADEEYSIRAPVFSHANSVPRNRKNDGDHADSAARCPVDQSAGMERRSRVLSRVMEREHCSSGLA